jgi:hypothetical protein
MPAGSMVKCRRSQCDVIFDGEDRHAGGGLVPGGGGVGLQSTCSAVNSGRRDFDVKHVRYG